MVQWHGARAHLLTGSSKHVTSCARAPQCIRRHVGQSIAYALAVVRLTVRVGQSDVASVCRHALAVLLADAADVVAPPKLRLAGVGLHQHLLDLCASLLLEDKGLLPAVLHVCEHVVVLEPHFVPTDAREALAAEEPLAVDGGARFESCAAHGSSSPRTQSKTCCAEPWSSSADSGSFAIAALTAESKGSRRSCSCSSTRRRVSTKGSSTFSGMRVRLLSFVRNLRMSPSLLETSLEMVAVEVEEAPVLDRHAGLNEAPM